MIHLDDHYFDFETMEAYRNVDYQNFNIRRKDCLVRIKYLGGEICRFDPDKQCWKPWMRPSQLGFERKCHVTEAYHKWLDEQIEKIVL